MIYSASELIAQFPLCKQAKKIRIELGNMLQIYWVIVTCFMYFGGIMIVIPCILAKNIEKCDPIAGVTKYAPNVFTL